MGKSTEKLLRLCLILWCFYLLFEATLYFFSFRLGDIQDVWPTSAIVYSRLLEKILGSLFVLIAVMTYFVQKDLNKYKTFIKVSAIWSLFHGSLLIFLGLTQNYVATFLKYPSLYVWFPFYNQYVILEGIVLIGYSVLVYLWLKDSK